MIVSNTTHTSKQRIHLHHRHGNTRVEPKQRALVSHGGWHKMYRKRKVARTPESSVPGVLPRQSQASSHSLADGSFSLVAH